MDDDSAGDGQRLDPNGNGIGMFIGAQINKASRLHKRRSQGKVDGWTESSDSRVLSIVASSIDPQRTIVQKRVVEGVGDGQRCIS